MHKDDTRLRIKPSPAKNNVGLGFTRSDQETQLPKKTLDYTLVLSLLTPYSYLFHHEKIFFLKKRMIRSFRWFTDHMSNSLDGKLKIQEHTGNGEDS